MPSSDRSLVDLVRETRRRLDRTIIVGISGIDCAGKSTLAHGLAADLRRAGENVVVVDGDDFNRPTSERARHPAEDPDYGFAYDQLVQGLLAPVRALGHAKARLRVKDWPRDEWTEQDFVVEPGSIVLVEGVFLLTPELLPLFDLTVWLEISFDEALARALQRDAEAMGGRDGVRRRYETRYFPSQRVHLERDRPRERADLIFGVS